MSKANEFDANETVLHSLVDNYPKEISALVGFHALTELAHTMAHEKFLEFVQSALHEALGTHQDFTSAQGETNSLQSS